MCGDRAYRGQTNMSQSLADAINNQARSGGQQEHSQGGLAVNNSRNRNEGENLILSQPPFIAIGDDVVVVDNSVNNVNRFRNRIARLRNLGVIPSRVVLDNSPGEEEKEEEESPPESPHVDNCIICYLERNNSMEDQNRYDRFMSCPECGSFTCLVCVRQIVQTSILLFNVDVLNPRDNNSFRDVRCPNCRNSATWRAAAYVVYFQRDVTREVLDLRRELRQALALEPNIRPRQGEEGLPRAAPRVAPRRIPNPPPSPEFNFEDDVPPLEGVPNIRPAVILRDAPGGHQVSFYEQRMFDVNLVPYVVEELERAYSFFELLFGGEGTVFFTGRLLTVQLPSTLIDELNQFMVGRSSAIQEFQLLIRRCEQWLRRVNLPADVASDSLLYAPMLTWRRHAERNRDVYDFMAGEIVRRYNWTSLRRIFKQAIMVVVVVWFFMGLFYLNNVLRSSL